MKGVFISKNLVILIVVLFAILYVLSIFISPRDKPIGGDKDEYGCLIAAGYSWCETKQKCIRAWEENCIEIEEEIDIEKYRRDCQSGYWCDTKQECIPSDDDCLMM